MELTGNAATGDVLASKTFYTTNPKSKQTGTLADKNGTTQSATATLDNTNSRLQMTIPATGRYNTSSKLYTAFSSVASVIGLTAAKLATGQKILGITGTYKGLGNAGTGDVLAGKTFSTASLSNATGTMTNRGAVTSSLNAGGSYTIPAGYHNGSGKVTANSLSSQTSATAAAADIVSGKTAWVNGSKVTGTMATMAGGTYNPSTSQQTISCSGKKMTSNIIISRANVYAYKTGTVTSGTGTRTFTMYDGGQHSLHYIIVATGFTVLGFIYYDKDNTNECGYSVGTTSAHYQRNSDGDGPRGLITGGITANSTQVILPVYYANNTYAYKIFGHY